MSCQCHVSWLHLTDGYIFTGDVCKHSPHVQFVNLIQKCLASNNIWLIHLSKSIDVTQTRWTILLILAGAWLSRWCTFSGKVNPSNCCIIKETLWTYFSTGCFSKSFSSCWRSRQIVCFIAFLRNNPQRNCENELPTILKFTVHLLCCQLTRIYRSCHGCRRKAHAHWCVWWETEQADAGCDPGHAAGKTQRSFMCEINVFFRVCRHK